MDSTINGKEAVSMRFSPQMLISYTFPTLPEETYTVTWIDGDGNTLKTEQVEYGTMPSYTGETPTKTATAEHTYTFKGWSPAIEKVTKDADFTAEFTDDTIKYSTRAAT